MENSSFNFTKEAIAKILPPAKDRVIYKDTKEQGLILMVSYTGKKSFYFAKNIKTKIGKKYYRNKIGDFPDLSIFEARARVFELKTQIIKGCNPFIKDPGLEMIKEMTFKQLLDKYIYDYAKHKIKRWKYVINDMDRQAKNLYDIGISSIQKSDIQKIFDHLSLNTGKTTANRFVERMSSIFNQAIEWEMLEKNPATRIKKNKENERDRYITAEEVDLFLDAVEAEKNPEMRDFILIALYTGIRKSNVISMRWKDISFKNQTWYLEDTKNGEPQHVVLSDEVIVILEERLKTTDNEWVFPSNKSASGHIEEPKKAMVRIKKRAGIQDLRIHDLRRTKGSWMAIAGASQYVIAKHLTIKALVQQPFMPGLALTLFENTPKKLIAYLLKTGIVTKIRVNVEIKIFSILNVMF